MGKKDMPVAPTPQLLVAGVEIPPDALQGILIGEDLVTFFGVRITPADASEAWMIQRRYQDFRKLYNQIQPETGHLAAVSFPRKLLGQCVGRKLELRRQGLELWLSEVVREAQLRQPGWLEPLSTFLDMS